MTAGRILDIAEDDIHLSAERGFLIVTKGGREAARLPLDQLDAVIVHAHGASYSNSLLVRLAERGCPVVFCGNNHAPAGVMWSVESHHQQSGRFDLQLAATVPLQKRLWQEIVRAKIRGQAEMLRRNEKPHHDALLSIAGYVKSGDPENHEAQAARRYWKAFFGPDFVRDQSLPGLNGMLNYGYTVLRALVARQVMASGLFPGMGLYHRNKNNALRLVDDLMEPFRPLVDHEVYRLSLAGHQSVERDVKLALASIGNYPVSLPMGETDLSVAVEMFVRSLVSSLEAGQVSLVVPEFGFRLEAT
ncbi:type II CRISPR-associated endonuclease Cas1 [Sneathiella chinensis]|uniref:CRISPR-associated endonuclease Cas1 n=1 Tax=Sneathiella chinensis TaxID=349750 RepID=A0ABQ5U4S9_9PROT|nr:type II CRISPR-associated endonuclease Cas1 [Sneathiella chinensis]GLQ07144.1 CRISPR-associated endonuclease Cas1 [Sneathiella chinensis]